MTEFKSQICTTVEQSDRLLGLGLKKETADMHYLWAGYWHLSLEPWEHAVDDYPFDFHSEEEQEDWKLRHRPAWSLHRLIEMMPRTIRANDDLFFLLVSKEDVFYDNTEGTAYSSFINRNGLYYNITLCIEWLIKKGYLNKKYLKEENS